MPIAYYRIEKKVSATENVKSQLIRYVKCELLQVWIGFNVA